MCVIKNVSFGIMEDTDSTVLFHKNKKTGFLDPPTFKFENWEDALKKTKFILEKKQFGVNLSFTRLLDFLWEEEEETINCIVSCNKLFVKHNQTQWYTPTEFDCWIPIKQIADAAISQNNFFGHTYDGYKIKPLSAKVLTLYDVAGYANM